MGHDQQPTESRRERQRRELTAEIVAIARRQLAEGGRAGVSWRAIAREVGMNPASLYTYFANLDELFTAMILESYGGLAHALERALAEVDGPTGPATPTGPAEGPPPSEPPRTEPLEAVVLAYRSWAVEHPAQYNLIFTDQIPGYAAPPGGPTVTAEVAVLEPLVRACGLVAGQHYSTADVDDVPPELMAGLLRTWGVLHGLVSLEINHHLPFVDDPGALTTASVLRTAVDGLAPRSTVEG